jgi:hypothetical protein
VGDSQSGTLCNLLHTNNVFPISDINLRKMVPHTLSVVTVLPPSPSSLLLNLLETGIYIVCTEENQGLYLPPSPTSPVTALRNPTPTLRKGNARETLHATAWDIFKTHEADNEAWDENCSLLFSRYSTKVHTIFTLIYFCLHSPTSLHHHQHGTYGQPGEESLFTEESRSPP